MPAAIRLLIVPVLAALLAGCALDRATARRAELQVRTQRDVALSCTAADACALASPYHALAEQAFAESAAGRPLHWLNLLDHGESSLALRVHLIRSARRSIDMQTFIFSEDDVGFFTLNELLAAARRGVRVRLITDQLFSIDDARLLAKLARAHANFELRLYNPTFDEARTAPLEFAAGILCCFFRFNQRMHNKLMLVDEQIGITGGRNIDNRYFDLSEEFNYRDRDVLVTGPAATQMATNFEAYWRHDTAVPLTRLKDVARRILEEADGPLPTAPPRVTRADRILALGRLADDPAWVEREYARHAMPARRVEYFADLPNKPFEEHPDYDRAITDQIAALFVEAEHTIVMQTPYLVFSRQARELIRDRRQIHPELRILVSTNSLAATDAFYVYAVSHKYKRRYLRQLGLEIFEYKPFPGRGGPVPASSEVLSGSASGAFGSRGPRVERRQPVPLTRPGVRRGMHAKSLVFDGEVAMIGSHNFDPRSDDLNTEAGLIVWDRDFAAALEASIRIDIAPENAWVIAKKRGIPVVSHVNHGIARVSEEIPFLDLWPFRYATSYELKPGCEPLPPSDPRFHECYEAVGEFPEVNLSLKQIYTRIVAAFGATLMPIL